MVKPQLYPAETLVRGDSLSIPGTSILLEIAESRPSTVSGSYWTLEGKTGWIMDMGNVPGRKVWAVKKESHNG